MAVLNKIPEKDLVYFYQMVDECILENQDPEMREGFKFIDEYALHNNLTIYEFFAELFEQREINSYIKRWKKEKGYK